MLFKNKHESKKTPSEFLVYCVQVLHEEAAKYGFAKKGALIDEGLIELGNPFIREGIRSRDLFRNDSDYFYSVATSNLQVGVVFARVSCIDRAVFSTGRFYEENPSPEDILALLHIGLWEDYRVTPEQWNTFRLKIIPLFTDLIEEYLKDKRKDEYITKLFSAYYILGVSIGLEKYES